MRIIGVIPARWASTRLPGKPLAELAGRPMIEHVYRRALRAGRLSSVVVATDDRRIVDAVLGFGGRAVMTRADHVSGTDRIWEVLEAGEADAVVNIQGDEPLIDPATIDAHYERALELSGGTRASLFVAFAESVSLPAQDRDAFVAFLNQAIAVDIDADPDRRLVNAIAQRRAHWLLAHADELILE